MNMLYNSHEQVAQSSFQIETKHMAIQISNKSTIKLFYFCFKIIKVSYTLHQWTGN